MSENDKRDILLDVQHLKKYFSTPRGMLHAVDDVSFQIERGKTLGVVGESGCGKSTIGRSILRLLEPTSGKVIFDGQDITALSKEEMRALRQKMQIIFQDPFSSLDPRMTVSQTIAEPLKLHGIIKDKKQREQRVLELMATVGLAERLYDTYPHELDGGRRQRIGIARALSVDPELIICDEAVSALDVSIQAQVLKLLNKLKAERSLTYIFITHDLSVVNHFADDIAVMYMGRMVEKAPSEQLFEKPIHPYTQALLSAIPIPDIHQQMKRIVLKGEVTSPIEPKPICRFAARCPYACDQCMHSEPDLVEVEPGHWVACHVKG